jgi:hypothetical protein
MADLQLPTQPLLLQMPEALSTTWNVVAVPGVFKGHASGPFELNDKVFSQIIANFARDPLGRINVDHDHVSETLAGDVSSRGAPAPAWIDALELRQGKLWGRWRWVDAETVENVRKGKIAYLSPAISFNSLDPVTGEERGARLSSVALTNKPFLRNIPVVKATLEEACETTFVPLSLPISDVHTPGSVGVKRKKMSDSAGMDAEMTRYASFVKKMRKLYALSEDADIDAVAEMADRNMRRLSEMESADTKRMEADADVRVAARVDGGVIPNTTEARAKARAFCLRDSDGFESLFPLPAKPAPARASVGQPTATDHALLTGRVVPRVDGGTQTDGIPGETPDYRTQLFSLTEELASKRMAAEPGVGADVVYMQAATEAKRLLTARAVKGVGRV